MNSENCALDPAQILQAYLDETAHALLTQNQSEFFDRLRFPHFILTESMTLRGNTKHDLQDLFHSVSAYLCDNGVTDYARLVKSARFETSTIIVGEWVTHILQDVRRLVEPYPSQGRLVLTDGTWRASHIVQGFRYNEVPFRLPVVSTHPVVRALDDLNQ